MTKAEALAATKPATLDPEAAMLADAMSDDDPGAAKLEEGASEEDLATMLEDGMWDEEPATAILDDGLLDAEAEAEAAILDDIGCDQRAPADTEPLGVSEKIGTFETAGALGVNEALGATEAFTTVRQVDMLAIVVAISVCVAPTLATSPSEAISNVSVEPPWLRPSSTPNPAPGLSQTSVPDMAVALNPNVGAASMMPTSAAMPRTVPPNSMISCDPMLAAIATLPLMEGVFGENCGVQPTSSLFAPSSKSTL